MDAERYYEQFAGDPPLITGCYIYADGDPCFCYADLKDCTSNLDRLSKRMSGIHFEMQIHQVSEDSFSET